MSFNREYLGAVSITSGAIKLSDAKESDQYDKEALRMALSIDGDPAGVGKTRSSLYVGVMFAEGKYSVFGYRNDSGELTSIEIHLDSLEE